MSKLRVSDHIAAYEIWDKWTHDIKISPFIVRLFEAVRNEIERPIMITSGYRSQIYQDYLRQIGYPAAILSPHTYGAALDMLYPTGLDKDNFTMLFREKSQQLGYGDCRIGRAKYNDTFLHVDIVYLLFEPYTRIGNPIPEHWKEGISW